MKKIFYPGLSIFAITFLLAAISVCGGCKKSSTGTPSSSTYKATSSSPGTNEVWIQNSAFTPASITVSVNTTIMWTNKDGVAHTVTSNTGLFGSPNISGGGTYNYQFTTAGTFPYHCTIHSSMSGTVIVQ